MDEMDEMDKVDCRRGKRAGNFRNFVEISGEGDILYGCQSESFIKIMAVGIRR